ncbi:MFS transporter [Clostridium sp.]|uniref:MFS transporter n=1 Tax=Clostridium sp. TaxID=1506 RepID=UPI003F2CCCFA
MEVINKDKINKLLFINFITMATFNMAHPVTPMLINELKLPSYMFGVLFSFMAVANFVMSPIWGSFSDQRGRKRFLALGVIGYGLSQVGFGYSTNIMVILVFRLLGGALSVCFVTTAIAYMTDLSSIKERVKYLSYHTASVSIGSSVGALLGGTIGRNNYRYTFLAQGILCVIITGIILCVVREDRNIKEEKLTVYLGHLKPNRTFIDFKTAIGSMILVMMLITMTTTAYNSTINYYIESVLHMPSTINGIVMAIAGVIGLCMNLFVNPYLGKRFNEYKSIKYTILITGVSILLASMMNNMIISIIFLVLFIAASSLVVPIQQSIVSKLARENYGEVMGIQGSAKAIGMIVGSLTAGFIFMIGNRLPFAFGGGCALIAGLVMVNLSRNIGKE